jgi:hypothetical protein
MFILLTSTEADSVRGLSTPSAALNPIEREGGVFLLGVEVLDDPAHKAHLDVLAKLPQKDIEDPDFAPELAVSVGSLNVGKG